MEQLQTKPLALNGEGEKGRFKGLDRHGGPMMLESPEPRCSAAITAPPKAMDRGGAWCTIDEGRIVARLP